MTVERRAKRWSTAKLHSVARRLLNASTLCARTLQMFDERSLDAGTLVTAKVARGRLSWLRTEVWT